ncbi:MAG: hypothetical protein ACOVP4_06015 [Bacteriovoracaceae bacterium]|jgi:hypothetical protein
MKFLFLCILFQSSLALATTYAVRDGNKSYVFIKNKNEYILRSQEFDLSISNCSSESLKKFDSDLLKTTKELNFKKTNSSLYIKKDDKILYAPVKSEAFQFFRDLPINFIKLKTLSEITCKK